MPPFPPPFLSLRRRGGPAASVSRALCLFHRSRASPPLLSGVTPSLLVAPSLIPRLSLSFPRAVSFTLALGVVRLRPRRHPLPKSSRETDCLAVKRQFIC